MTGERRKETVTMHSVSCTRLEWERIRECARREGLTISRFVVNRALERDPSPNLRNPPRLVLSQEEQRAMRDTVAELAERLDAFRGDGETPGFGDVARILFELKLNEMTRTGRHATMTRLLEAVARQPCRTHERGRLPAQPPDLTS